jgi:ribosome-associated protein
MDIRKLQRAIVDGLEDVKAQNIVVFNTEHLSPLFERVIVASGTSNRQTKALASSVRETVKARGLPVLSTEGADNGEWIIVDCGAAVAHIMQPAIRDYYRLEEIWGDKPVRLKLDSGERRLPKAGSSRGSAHGSPAPERHRAKKSPALRKTTAAKKKPAPAKQAVAATARAKKVASSGAPRSTAQRAATHAKRSVRAKSR